MYIMIPSTHLERQTLNFCCLYEYTLKIFLYYFWEWTKQAVILRAKKWLIVPLKIKAKFSIGLDNIPGICENTF